MTKPKTSILLWNDKEWNEKVPGCPMLIKELYHNKEIISPEHGRYHPRHQLRCSAITDNPGKTLRLERPWMAHCPDSKSQNTPPDPETSWCFSCKESKSLSHWKDTGELKNTQMSLGFATTKQSVSWKYPEPRMAGQDFSTFFTSCGMEGKMELFTLALPFYTDHVTLVSFYTANWKTEGSGHFTIFYHGSVKPVCAVFIWRNTASQKLLHASHGLSFST